MMEKMTRRTFMKGVGAVALAAAFAGSLTACAPAGTGIEASDIKTTHGFMNNRDGSKKYFGFVMFTVKNTSGASITLTRDIFTVKLDGGTEQKIDSVYDQVADGLQTFGSKELKAGESAAIAVSFDISQSVYDSWKKDDHKIELIAHNNNTTSSFTVSSKN